MQHKWITEREREKKEKRKAGVTTKINKKQHNRECTTWTRGNGSVTRLCKKEWAGAQTGPMNLVDLNGNKGRKQPKLVNMRLNKIFQKVNNILLESHATSNIK